MSEKTIEKEYEAALAGAIPVNPAFPYHAKVEMAALVEEEMRANANILTFLKHETTAARRGGFIAEEFHSTTYNMDAIVKGKTARAQTGLDNGILGNNDQVSDIVIADAGQVGKRIQSKYNCDAQTTANQHSALQKDGLTPKYEQADVALSPSDQAEAVRQSALEGAARHRAKAQRLSEGGGQPQVIQAHEAKAKAYEQTAQKTASKIEHDGASSTPLSKSEAETMGDGDLGKLEDLQSKYKTQSTLQNMGKAAAGAAAMSAVVAGTVNIVNYVSLVRSGKLDASEAAIRIAAETAASAADSAIKAAATTGLQSLVIRQGSRELARKMASQSVGALMRSNVISVAAVCAIDGIKDLVLFGAGKITLSQLEERSGKNLFTTSAGVVGSSIGASICGGLAVGGGLTIAALPVLGGLAGGLIASMAMAFAIENGIEAPYRDLVTNTEALRDSARTLQEVSRQVFQAQVNFERFLVADAVLDQAFDKQAAGAMSSKEMMRLSIDKI